MAQFQDVQDFVRNARKASTLPELRALLEVTATTFGFRYFVLGHHVNVLRGAQIHISNYPQDFADQVKSREHFANDPVLRACQTTVAGFRWSELPVLIPMSRAQEDILRSARRAGIGEGYTIPANVPGECLGSCSFAVKSGKAIDERILPAIQYIGCFGFEAARRLARQSTEKRRRDEGAPLLTPRQLDCLILVAQGKSDWSAGQVLGIHKRTVHEYIEAAKGKYGVASRVQLVIRALFDNQLGFGDILPN